MRDKDGNPLHGHVIEPSWLALLALLWCKLTGWRGHA